ncbi:ankyrin repeat-containing domain protein [Aspergillus carlsbadensis]|nr:ankyrin repeat-containing domain protein [Aspergillus carlsbadensis]
MARLEHLPTELFQRIVCSVLHDVWNITHMSQFIALRRVCHKFNACVQQEISRLPIDNSGCLYFPAATKLNLLHLVRAEDTADGKLIVHAITRAVQEAVLAKAESNDIPEFDVNVIERTRAQYSAAITAVVYCGFRSFYSDFLAGRVWGVHGLLYQLTFLQCESHALAILGAAQEGDVAMLELLLSRNFFKPPPGLVDTFLGPLILAIRGEHMDAVNFLLSRWDSHGDVDRPDAPNAEGDCPIHWAARVGSIPLVQLFLARLSGRADLLVTVQAYLSRPESNQDTTRAYPGMTPLDVAASAGRLALVKYLCAIPGTCRTGGGGLGASRRSTIYHAVCSKNIEVIEFLLAQPETVITTPNPLDSPLVLAATLGRLDIAKVLVEKGRVASEAEQTAIYHTCLMFAVNRGDTALFDYFFSKKGIPLGARLGHEGDNISLLVNAVMAGQDEMFERLVSCDEIGSDARRDALFVAARMGKVHILQRLLDAGDLGLESVPEFGRDAMWAARGRLDVVELFRRYGIVDTSSDIGIDIE